MRPLLLPLVCLAACASPAPPSPAAPAAHVASTEAPPASPVFLEDDYAGAIAEARATKRPLFVDAWAEWCHTCLSMRAYVFADPALRPLAKDFVWLSMDTEKPAGQEFLARFPMNAWPTLWVIDPETEKPALKWLGAATATELVGLLDDAKSSVLHGDGGGQAGAALLRGNQASAAGRGEEAVAAYREALAAAPPGWPKRGRTVEALVARLAEAKDYAACTDTASGELPRIPPGTSRANVALAALECSERAPEGSPAHARQKAMAEALTPITLDAKLPILADDRSSLFEALVGYHEEFGTKEELRSIASQWASFLEEQASRAATPAARAVFDAHRVNAYVALGEPGRAVPMLQQSAKDFPNDYNPPARLARAQLELKQYDEALVSIDRALSLGYGPRKLRLFATKADILTAKGDSAGLAALLKQALEYAKSLPPSERTAREIAGLEKRLATTTPK